MTLLDRIDRPQDLHSLGEDGGHFGASLGTCEIAVALPSLLDSPRDKIVWDVGHQAYPHKVLTGRRDALGTIRKYGGLAPFCAIHESPHDIMGAGHASTSIGYGVGIKEAMRRGDGKDGRVVAVIGDGAMTGGAAFERLGPQFKESIKAFTSPGLLWEELDWAYLGVIDGHDVRALRRALKSAFEAERPVVVHCATVKGKGFAPAEDGGLE